jgi:kynurenine formamidase
MGIKVIGSDILSPDEFIEQREGVPCFDVHRVILGAGGVIAENLNNLESLLEVDEYMVSLLPLKLDGCDGSPVRATAWPMGSKC